MPIIAADKLRATVNAMCKAAGSSDYEAELVADNLVMANLSGHDSHGVGMLPAYFDNLHAGGLKVNQHAEVVRDEGAVMVVDGNAGFGQVIGKESMDIAIARAKEKGVCVLAIRNSHHLCRIGAWAEQCAAAGLVSMHHTVGRHSGRRQSQGLWPGADQRTVRGRAVGRGHLPAGDDPRPIGNHQLHAIHRH